ncbi:MAG: hypothetical protein F7C32_02000 [Desulfurococcales archaeon]|nr:hypothetical protein [Desulfurococcales archaeon]
MVEESPQEKRDLEKLLSLIPPASALKSRKRHLTEKRIRIRYDDSLDEEEAKIPKSLADELGIKEYLEIVVAGRKRFVFRAIVEEGLEENRVYINPDLMEEHGIADNSIATVRPHRGGEELGVLLEES